MEIGNEGNEMTSGNKGYILKRNKSSFNLLSTTNVLTENLVNIVCKFCFQQSFILGICSNKFFHTCKCFFFHHPDNVSYYLLMGFKSKLPKFDHLKYVSDAIYQQIVTYMSTVICRNNVLDLLEQTNVKLQME